MRELGQVEILDLNWEVATLWMQKRTADLVRINSANLYTLTVL